MNPRLLRAAAQYVMTRPPNPGTEAERELFRTLYIEKPRLREARHLMKTGESRIGRV